jgi:hypothetical protein
VASKGREGEDREDKGTGVVKCKLKCKSARRRCLLLGRTKPKNQKISLLQSSVQACIHAWSSA